MSIGSGDSINRSSAVNVELCYCGLAVKLRTSWTDRNPSRRFVGCAAKSGNRHYFFWRDPIMCERATMIIPGLIRQKNFLEAQVAELKRKNDHLKVVCCGCLVAIVALLLARFL